MEMKLIKKIPLRHLSVMDPKKRYQLLEAGRSQYLLDYETMEVTHLIEKKMIRPLWTGDDIYYRTESSTTYCYNLKDRELFKSKRYECDIYSSKLIETETCIVRYDAFTHNVMLWDKESRESSVKILPLKENQRAVDMIPAGSDLYLVSVINDPKEGQKYSYYEFQILDIRTFELMPLSVNEKLIKKISHSIIYGIYYLRSTKMWALYIGHPTDLLILNHDLTEILYRFEASKENIDIHSCLTQYIESRDLLLFESCKEGVSYLDQQDIYALDLKTMECRKWVSLDQYSPYYYNTRYGYLIIESTRNYRGLIEIYQVDL